MTWYILSLMMVQAAFSSGIWYKKHYSRVTGSTGDFASALNEQEVSFWEGSAEIDVKQALGDIQGALPVALAEKDLRSFIDTLHLFKSSQTNARHFWVSTELKQGELQYLSLVSKDGSVKYYAIKAATSIPDHGEWKQDCKKKRRLFHKKTKCGDSYFVPHGLNDHHLGLVQDKLEKAIKSQYTYRQIMNV